mgnify:CR=1 FL=1|tara:strand:+ start:2156 stop:2665 length:510 start_codon:yes stop_codon:yes gene_type:complete
MSTPQYLVHGKTGRVFNYSANLAKRADMEPAAGIDEANTMAKRLGGAPLVAVSDTAAPVATAVADRLAALESTVAFLSSRLDALESEPADNPPSADGAVDVSSEEPVGSATEPSDQTTEADDAFVISTATKDQLETFAKAEYGTDLDKRKSVDTLRAEVAELAQAGDGA